LLLVARVLAGVTAAGVVLVACCQALA